MSSKSKARLPVEPLISIRMAFLRPVAKRVASKTPTAPPLNRARKAAVSSTVTSPICSAGAVGATRRAAGRRPAPPPGAGATNVSSSPLTVTIRSPVMCWVRSTMWAPMSPSAPEPALSFSSRQLIGAERVGEPVLEVLRPHVPDLADAALLARAGGPARSAGTRR